MSAYPGRDRRQRSYPSQARSMHETDRADGRSRFPHSWHLQLAYRTVELHHLLRTERLGTIQDLARPRIGLAHFLLLVVGQGQDAQGKQLVDLGGVKEVAWAFRRDARVI